MFSIILVLLIAAQPMQAGFCAMPSSGDAPQPANMQHAGMQHAGMQHPGMQHDPAADGAGHDCCAAANPDSDPGCAGLDQCGSCTASLAAVPALSRPCVLPAASDRVLPIAGRLAPSHAAPPYRPPSVIS
jgi:uncharacterized protein involved in copper resistance